jgi:uncharacterized protein YhhL (DUF1145 family)
MCSLLSHPMDAATNVLMHLMHLIHLMQLMQLMIASRTKSPRHMSLDR